MAPVAFAPRGATGASGGGFSPARPGAGARAWLVGLPAEAGTGADGLRSLLAWEKGDTEKVRVAIARLDEALPGHPVVRALRGRLKKPVAGPLTTPCPEARRLVAP